MSSKMVKSIVKIKKLKCFICIFWLFLIIVVVICKEPCPPIISNHPWSKDFIKFLVKIMDILVSGWLEIRFKNHILVKKNLILLVFFGKGLCSHRMNANARPNRMTAIVVNLRLKGIINVCGLNVRKIDWSIDPVKIAARDRVVVDQLI